MRRDGHYHAENGNAQDHVKFAHQFIKQGFTHLIFHASQQDQQTFLDAYSRDALTRLRMPAVAVP